MKKKRKRRSAVQREKYILNYTISNVSKRTGESRAATLAWLKERTSEAMVCPFCLKDIKLGGFAVDHKTPIYRGGSRLLENCWLTCQVCNRAKGDLTVEEYMSLYMFLIKKGNEYMKKSVLARMRLGWGRIGRS